jgi:hypothetical protein
MNDGLHASLTSLRRPRSWRTRVLTLAVLIALPAESNTPPAPEPVRHIGIYVTPFYAAASTRTGTPQVSVAREFDAMFASNRMEDLVAARDAIQARPGRVPPMVLMVLAIRLYDMGLRDDSVFWFYAAKNRFLTMDDVLDLRAAGLAGMAVAVTDFAKLAGPAINSYAFCDYDQQAAAARQAVDWVEAHPYEPLFDPGIVARSGDRVDLLQRSITRLRETALREREFVADAKNRELMEARRKANRVPEQFC